jgi:hypothetical protein
MLQSHRAGLICSLWDGHTSVQDGLKVYQNILLLYNEGPGPEFLEVGCREWDQKVSVDPWKEIKAFGGYGLTV